MVRRPTWHLILSGVLVGLFTAQTFGEVYTVRDFAGGLHDTDPAIFDNEVQVLENFHVNPFNGGLEQRMGSQRTNSTQFTGKKAVDVWTYVQDDTDEFILIKSSKTVGYSTDDGATFTTLITTATDASVWEGVNFKNGFWWTSQSNGGQVFYGSTITRVTAMPSGKYIQKYQNRLFVANTSANNNRLFFSGLSLPLSWTTSTDWIDLPEPITGIGKPFDNGLPLYTVNQTWILRGTTKTDFRLQQISENIGCADNRTIQNFSLKGNNYQVFLSKGPDRTKNNMYALDGVQVIPIGNKIRSTLSNIQIGNFTLRQKTWTSRSDFQAGTVDQVTLNYNIGSVVLSTNNTNVNNYSFENGTGTTATQWTAPSWDRDDCIPDHGTYHMNSPIGASYSFSLQLRDASTNELIDSSNYTPNSSAYQTFTFTPTNRDGLKRRIIKLRFNESITDSSVISDPIQASGQNITFRARTYPDCGSSYPSLAVMLDKVEGGRSTISTGTFTSEIFSADSSLTSWDRFEADYAANGGSINFYVRTAATSGGIAAKAWTSIVPGVQVSSTTNTFFQWKAVLNAGSETTGYNPIINSVSANYYTGSNTSQPLGSIVFNNEYWMSYTGNNDGINKTAIVLNSQGAASVFTGLKPYSFAVQTGRLFAGDSSTDTVNGGYVWEYERGVTDNGSAIAARVKFGDSDLGFWDYEKNLNKTYFTYQVAAGTATQTITRNISENANSFTLYLSTGTGYSIQNVINNQQVTGRTFALELYNSYPSTLLNLYPPLTYHFQKVRLVK